MIGPDAGEAVAVGQTAMLAGLPYTGLRYAILAHPTMLEGSRLPIFKRDTSACTTRHAEKRRRVTDGKSASHRAADVLLILENFPISATIIINVGVDMAESNQVAYTSRVRIERKSGPMRLAYLPAEKEPVIFGVHSEVAEHYKVSPDAYPPHATTLDYVVAAAAG